MPFQPEKIKRDHVLKAAKLIDSGEYKIAPSTGFDVVVNGKKYPPKEIMRFAHEQATGEFLWHPGGGEPTNKYLKALGFEIIDKQNDTTSEVISTERKYILVNITWNSKDWKEPSDDKSNHKYVSGGNIPHESWNFDFDNKRNTDEFIYGFGQFTNPPKVEGDNNLLIFYSQNQIVGFYGKAEVLAESVEVNKRESYNLIGSRPLCVLLKNKITNVKEKGYLEDKQRVGQIGFSYLQKPETIKSIINEAINLNPEESIALNKIADWLQLDNLHEDKHWLVFANSNHYDYKSIIQPNKIYEWGLRSLRDENPESGDKFVLIDYKNNTVFGYGKVITNAYQSDTNDSQVLGRSPKSDKNVDFPVVKIKFDEINIFENEELADIMSQLGNFNSHKLIDRDTYYKLLRNKLKTMDNSLNKILFGPPGTGKTYNTISEAIKIVDNTFYESNSTNRDALQKRFNELLIKEWKNSNGQIAFCTFHQSFSYEDFVEGIKPRATDDKKVYYEIEDGIFKSICRHADATNNAQALAKGNLVSFTQEQFNEAVFYKVSLGDTSKAEGKEVYDYCISNNVISIGFGEGIDFSGKNEEQVNESIKDNNLDSYSAQAINYFKNYLQVGNYVIISNGNLYIRALGKVTGEYKFEKEAGIGHNHFRSVEWIFKDVEIPVNEFYEKNLSQQTIYKLKKEFIIPEFFVKAGKQSEVKSEPKNFVIIIDEINRGNVSSIFGELITLIEPTKRAGQPEALEVVLPYSKKRFTVPSNVYIIGTMNTADRSIESLDTALRRRFSFKEMAPQSSLIKTEGKSKGVVDGIDLVKLLDKINDRIEKLIDKDHKIGHSYFINVNSVDELRLAFKDKVIPLLEEYFFGDFGKIGLVLGGSFVKKEVSEFEFAKFEDYDSQAEQDLKQRAVYLIKPSEEWDFKSVYEARS